MRPRNSMFFDASGFFLPTLDRWCIISDMFISGGALVMSGHTSKQELLVICGGREHMVDRSAPPMSLSLCFQVSTEETGKRDGWRGRTTSQTSLSFKKLVSLSPLYYSFSETIFLSLFNAPFGRVLAVSEERGQWGAKGGCEEWSRRQKR